MAALNSAVAEADKGSGNALLLVRGQRSFHIFTPLRCLRLFNVLCSWDCLVYWNSFVTELSPLQRFTKPREYWQLTIFAFSVRLWEIRSVALCNSSDFSWLGLSFLALRCHCRIQFLYSQFLYIIMFCRLCLYERIVVKSDRFWSRVLVW